MDGPDRDAPARRVGAWLAAAEPRRILVIGVLAKRLLRESEAAGSAVVDIVPWEERTGPLAALARRERADAAVLSDIAEMLPRAGAEAVIARVRDVLAPRMLLLVRANAWAPSELRALGFASHARLEDDEGGLRLYRFEIDRYKRTPDWLNPRHWAHPELWDRYRW